MCGIKWVGIIYHILKISHRILATLSAIGLKAIYLYNGQQTLSNSDEISFLSRNFFFLQNKHVKQFLLEMM